MPTNPAYTEIIDIRGTKVLQMIDPNDSCDLDQFVRNAAELARAFGKSASEEAARHASWAKSTTS